MRKSEWILCPVCGNKTRDRIRVDTEFKKFPLFCPKCKHEMDICISSSERMEIVWKLQPYYQELQERFML